MNLDTDNYDVIIVGDGIVGKCAALAFAQQYLRVALIKTRPSSHHTAENLYTSNKLSKENKPANDFSKNGSRVYALSSTSQNLFQQLKIWQKFPKDNLTPVINMHIFGDRNGMLKFSAYQAALPQLCWTTYSQLIEEQLVEAIEFNHKITSIAAQTITQYHEPDHVFIGLDSGQKIGAKLLIGADGANSWVRKQGNFNLSKIDYRQSAIVANFQAEYPHNETARQWFFNTKMNISGTPKKENDEELSEILAFLPLNNNQISIVWSANKLHADHLMQIPISKFIDEIRSISSNILGNLEIISERHCFSIKRQNVKQLINKRTVLIGDAAHVIHPLAGQGLNLGLKDVVVLSTLVGKRKTFHDCGNHSILARYQRARLEDIKKFSLITDSLQKLFAFNHPLAQFLRNKGMSIISKSLFLKKLLIQEATE